MGLEIERKYLIKSMPTVERGERIVQGYLTFDPTIRVRLKGERGRLTIKFRAEGLKRYEYEYEIPASDARELLDRCQGRSRRRAIGWGGSNWMCLKATTRA